MWYGLFFPLLLSISSSRCSLQEDVINIPIPKNQNSISGINFIYFINYPPKSDPTRTVEELSNNDIEELEQKTSVNPYLNKLFQNRNVEQIDKIISNTRHPHNLNRLRSFRRKRNASPTYKKGYSGGGGGGGCCSTCGGCGGGCSGGGCGGGSSSASYSQSSSYSSSSSGSYSSGRK
ncbi:hypothetical protein HHI36_004995 [Cryptolaemus montrouzieri]|uniref:Uncharacterized protein n=1 Tax=Cryptolaemus montrouzieri TaxID=559131 RepID=A0ABD2NT51_9CUCU